MKDDYQTSRETLRETADEPKSLAARIGRGVINAIYGTTALLVAAVALFWLLDSAESTPESKPAQIAQATAPAAAPGPAATKPDEPSSAFLALVAKIEAPNTLGAPVSLQNPAHVEMLGTIADAAMSSPQHEAIRQLVNAPEFAMVYLDCGDCAGDYRAGVHAWATAFGAISDRCMRSSQHHAQWPRRMFECVMGEEDALIELQDRMSGDSGDIAELQRLDRCLASHIRGQQFHFGDANACVSKATGGPQVGYTFAKR